MNIIPRFKHTLTVAGIYLITAAPVFSQSWPEITTEARPATRWWWLGSAVDTANLTYNLETYAQAGLGGVEITPIYGVQGNDAHEIPFLSPVWMQMLQHTRSECKRLGMETNMNAGTGWPFGGPMISLEHAATKAIFQEYAAKGGERLQVAIDVEDPKQRDIAYLNRLMAFSDKGDRIDITSKVKNNRLDWTAPSGNWRLIALFCGKTFQQVKRAAPGGEGYVMDHFSRKAVKQYFGTFEQAFRENKVPYPHSFFNDSYEVYGADWTPDLLSEFVRRRGYRLENYLPEFLNPVRTDTTARIRSDYRETLAELLQENFTRQWTEWAHRGGSITRNQAHGSPGNLIDLYATVDIPECEGFGLSRFHIRGLRQDSLTRKNDSDLSMLKYASSAAHIAGKKYTSSETFTWLTEHFRTSLSQCKPDMDLMFVSGVNHMFFHGTPYSPREAEWPGWLFYASVNMSPTNSIWRDAPAFFDYIARCQSFLQMGKPDNDFLVYLPVYDMWHEAGERFLAFDIHKMQQRAPQFIHAIHTIYNSGYDVDYISDNFIRSTSLKDGKVATSGGSLYKALIVPGARYMPADILNHLVQLAKEGATIVFVGNYPEDVPGFGDLDKRRKRFRQAWDKLPEITSFGETTTNRLQKGRIVTGSDYALTLQACEVAREEMKTRFGLQCIRRSNANGYHYFIASLQEKDVDGWVPLGVQANAAILFDPMTEESGAARIRRHEGKTEVYLQIPSGGSLILQTFTGEAPDCPAWKYIQEQPVSIGLDHGWTLSFPESEPAILGIFEIDRPASWTTLAHPDARRNMGTARYSLTFDLPEIAADDWILDLGDVRESARVRINGQEAGTVWAVPFRLKVGKYLVPDINRIEVEVTNLPANRIADYDRRKKDWRIFKEINIVDLDYQKKQYDNWEPVPSGLNSPVRLIPVTFHAKYGKKDSFCKVFTTFGSRK
ncbi:glycosyl hydrolase [uncultured Parabacteroides sp.]|uniref:alpha-L-rhamnosidase n=3 Tax=uncultured Parabacteroides sp. TaxID=512312 RepID=UPI00265A3CAD|nr:glycosyl hydrolase [uncultured Parabacteroides sp.]